MYKKKKTTTKNSYQEAEQNGINDKEKLSIFLV